MITSKEKRERVQFVIDYLRETPKFKHGICYALDGVGASNIVEEYAPLWDEYSGRPSFPVPPPKGYIASCWAQSDAYGAFCDLDCTKGEYGKSRKRLANFLADCIEEDMGYWV